MTGYPEMTARRRLNAEHPIEVVGPKTASDDALD
jgi:ketol-acid reductoisomerase